MHYVLTFVIASLMSFQIMAADLKSQDVSLWLTSMQALKPWLEQHEKEFTAHISEPNNPAVAFKESIGAIKKAGLYDELNGKVKKLGYDDVEEWSATTQQVTFAWMALEMDANKDQIDAAKAQYAAMKANPDIPAAQKAIMEQMMVPALAMVELAGNASSADKAAVKPHQKTLHDYFTEDEK